MAISDEVIKRAPADLLRNLTNPGVTQPSTIDTTRLGAAADDAQADFEDYTGLDFDITEKKHVELIIEGVILKLQRYTLKQTVNEKPWLDRLRAFAAKRIEPQTDSEVERSSENPEGGDAPRPFFDDSRFDRFRLNPPGGREPYGAGANEDED